MKVRERIGSYRPEAPFRGKSSQIKMVPGLDLFGFAEGIASDQLGHFFANFSHDDAVVGEQVVELLAMSIRELVDCWVGVCCTDRCNRTSYLPLKLMAAKRSGRERLQEVVAKLRCQYSKTPPSSIWLVDYPVENGEHGGQLATWRIELTPSP